MKKPDVINSKSGAAGRVCQAPGDSKMRRELPLLFEFLTETRWEDGTERQPGTMILFCEQGRFKACLNDKELQRVAFCTAETLEGLLEACNEGFGDDGHDWRASGGKWKK
jgi:hypothetical protein